jgi:hypothetical protein
MIPTNSDNFANVITCNYLTANSELSTISALAYSKLRSAVKDSGSDAGLCAEF